MDNWKKDRIAAAASGTNPTVLAKMKSGYAVFGDTQFLPGYCVLLAYPRVNCLNDLSMAERATFLTDMTVIGDAITQVYAPHKMNYDVLGNAEDFLHGHIFPRYEWEEPARRIKPMWQYPGTCWSAPAYQFTQPQYQVKRMELQSALVELMRTHYQTE